MTLDEKSLRDKTVKAEFDQVQGLLPRKKINYVNACTMPISSIP